MWREHLPYTSATDVTASNTKIYCATPYSLFSVDISSLETERISKVSGLSETGISTIRFDRNAQKLFVAYTNSNIDVIDEKGIHNIPDLKRKNISGDKMIYHLFADNNRCYLSTGLGVIVLDAVKYEVRESWFFAKTGGYIKTNGLTKNNGFFYAATQEGLKRASASSNPSDFNNWQTLSGNNGLPLAEAKAVVNLQGKTIVLQNDSLYVENGNAWNLFFANGWQITSVNVSENKLITCQRLPNGNSRVVVLQPDGLLWKEFQQGGVISFPKNAISVNGTYWIADLYGGLSQWMDNRFEIYQLNGPADLATGGMAVYHNSVYATSGSVNDSWNYQYNRNGFFQLSNGKWSTYNKNSYPQLDSLLDFITIVADPRDASVWAGSYGGGLLHIKTNKQLEIFKQNTPIGPTPGDPTSYRVSGLAFDAQYNLWVSNFGADRLLHVLKKDGKWQSFAPPFPLNLNAVSQIVIDQDQQVWIVSPMGTGLLVFNHNNTIDNPSDDRWKLYRMGTGLGNLPSNEVISLVIDKSGFIWVGTKDGIGVIHCPQETFTSGCNTLWPVIKEGNFANYLFKGQEVRSIAVDGADRKWVATSNGAWLINPDGDRVLMHFTEDNSPLLSSDVKTIAIDGQTGEVFFATAKGISSFRGEATEAIENKGQVLVYPNPVPPAYNGSIGIKGLPENSLVKITETNGRLVFQTRSLGGQAIWNGKDVTGRQAASGIYLVLATDETNRENVVAKIVLISK